MASHILWQSEQKTITLIDIPRSIVEAQGFNSPDDHDLLSIPPRDVPYPSTEPKSAAAKARLMDNTVDQDLHAQYRVLLTEALQEVRQHHKGDWCLTRTFVEDLRPKKRKFEDPEDSAATHPSASGCAIPTTICANTLPDCFLSTLARAPLESFNGRIDMANMRHATQEPGRLQHGDSRLYDNDGEEHLLLSLATSSDDDAGAYRFSLPPRSAFYLGDCAGGQDFRKAIRQRSQQQGKSSLFDFILLDPPWPNRSIKRTHQTAGATYKTMATLNDLGDLILDMDLENHMAKDAVIGVWITNKQAVRELVLGLGGFFECWGVELVEEWIWLKTTISGEPTSVLDAMWKKPYEVLLLGRRQDSVDGHGRSKSQIQRRVIIGVPDLHSRKPCLKELIKPMMPDPMSYATLEIFARHLVAGWTSWGDECIKYNSESYWRHRSGS